MRSHAWWGFCLLALAAPSLRAADHHHTHDGPAAQQLPGNQPRPVNVPLPNYGNGQSSSHHHHHGSGGSYGGGTYVGYPWLTSYTLGVPYSPYFYGPYVLPPLVIPADTMFGPRPMAQFMGLPLVDQGDPPPRVRAANWNNNPNLANGQNIGNGLGAGAAAPGPKADPPRKPRTTNAASKTRAGKFMQFGDQQFAKQKFHQALERYREATVAAPDLAEAHFRQGFALFATGQYESAGRSFQRGLRIKPSWADADLSLAALYGDGSHLTRQSHREALAQAIEANPLATDQLMVMGMVLYFDGEPDRSRLFFEHAADRGGNDEHLLDAFLAPRPRDADKEAALPAAGAKF